VLPRVSLTYNCLVLFEPRDSGLVCLFPAGAHSVGSMHVFNSDYIGSWTTTTRTFDNAYYINLLNLEWRPKAVDWRTNSPWSHGTSQFESVETFGTRRDGQPFRLSMLIPDMVRKGERRTDHGGEKVDGCANTQYTCSTLGGALTLTGFG
jgi:hypothetical protein